MSQELPKYPGLSVEALRKMFNQHDLSEPTEFDFGEMEAVAAALGLLEPVDRNEDRTPEDPVILILGSKPISKGRPSE